MELCPQKLNNRQSFLPFNLEYQTILSFFKIENKKGEKLLCLKKKFDICQSFLTTRPVFSFLYFLKFLVLIYQNSIFKILYLLIFLSSFQIFYSFFQIHNGLPLKRYNSIRNLFFLAISKHLRKTTDNFRKIN